MVSKETLTERQALLKITARRKAIFIPSKAK